MKKFALLIFLITFIVYFFTSGGDTPFNYFTRLADAFLHGKYFLTENPPWLSELIPGGSDKFFVVYPPMPAIIAIPFVFFFSKTFPQQYLAHGLGAGIVAFTFLIAWEVTKNKLFSFWSSILVGLGTIIWFLSSVGSAWYLGQISSAFFLTFAIYELLTNKRSFLVGILLGAAFLSRLQVILSLPLFMYLLKDKKPLKIISGIIPFAVFYTLYNYLRFGSPFETGYSLIPGILSEPWFQKGIFSITYITRHLKVIFESLPNFKSDFPFITPSWTGLAIWITTPAFIYSLIAPIKERVVQLSWLSIILIALVDFSHGSTGFAQFGYRFAVDFYPFLILLTIKGVAKNKLFWHHWLLLIIGIIANAWGVIFINKLGWVGF